MHYIASSVSEIKMQLNRNLYCFGAGRAFETFIHEFKQFQLESDIKAIVDNNADKLQMSTNVECI